MISRYHAFLIRMWQNTDQSKGQWFMSLEDPSSHKMTYFKTKEELFSFLRDILNEKENLSSLKPGAHPTENIQGTPTKKQNPLIPTKE